MNIGLRGLTLGCMLVAGTLSPMVHASPVVLDFEGLPLQQAVGTAYTGFEFNGDNTVLDDTFFTASPFAPSVQFIVSRNGFVVDVLNASATPFNALNFDYYGALDITIVDTAGGKTTLKIDLSSPDWLPLGSAVLLDKSTRIDYVEFAPGATSIGRMGIDNLSFDLQPGSVTPPPPNPNPVPEPAGYGLAALALLGVGLASRRRR